MLSPRVERRPPGLQPDALPLTPGERDTCAAPPVTVGCPRVERGVCWPQTSWVSVSLAPVPPGAGSAPGFMPSAVEFPTVHPTGRGRGSTGGRSRTRNVRLWRPLLCQLSYARMFCCRCPGTRNAARSRSGWAASALLIEGPLGAPPPRLVQLLADRSAVEGPGLRAGLTAARRELPRV